MPDQAGQPAEPGEGLRDAAARPGSFFQTASAVAWSFFGVRKAHDSEADLSRINPVHIVLAGVLGGALFVVTLVLIVKWVVAK